MRLHKRSLGFIVPVLLFLTLALACGGGDSLDDLGDTGDAGGDTGGAATTGAAATGGSSSAGSNEGGGAITSGSTIAPAALAEIGQPAPDFALTVYENTNYERDQVVNLSDLRGKPVVINFWFPACTQCQELMFLLKDSYNANMDDVHFVAIQVAADSKSEWDPGGSDTESGQSYVTDKKLEFIVGADFDGTIATSYGVNAYPKTYFLDKDLNLVSTADYLKARGIKDNLQAAKK